LVGHYFLLFSANTICLVLELIDTEKKGEIIGAQVAATVKEIYAVFSPVTI